MILNPSINPDTWDIFIDFRKQDKAKPLTDRAVKMLLNKLHRLEEQGHCPNLLLERSIINGWQDVYPDNSTLKNSSFIATHTDRSWRESFVQEHSDKSWANGLKLVK